MAWHISMETIDNLVLSSIVFIPPEVAVCSLSNRHNHCCRRRFCFSASFVLCPVARHRRIGFQLLWSSGTRAGKSWNQTNISVLVLSDFFKLHFWCFHQSLRVMFLSLLKIFYHLLSINLHCYRSHVWFSNSLKESCTLSSDLWMPGTAGIPCVNLKALRQPSYAFAAWPRFTAGQWRFTM